MQVQSNYAVGCSPENDRRHLVRRSCVIIAGAKWVKSPTTIFNYGYSNMVHPDGICALLIVSQFLIDCVSFYQVFKEGKSFPVPGSKAPTF